MSRKLFSPLNPLKLSFAPEFFGELPEAPGVYRMYDQNGSLLYVGKAKSLRDRLKSYRNCCPTELPRKVQRLIDQVRDIQFDLYESEQEALVQEVILLQRLKPPYNRMNTHPENYSYLHLAVGDSSIAWKFIAAHNAKLLGTLKPTELYGAFRSRRTLYLKLARLFRLLWMVETQKSPLPRCLLREEISSEGSFYLSLDRKVKNQIRSFFEGRSSRLIKKINAEELSGFEKYLFQKDQEDLLDFFRSTLKSLSSIRKKMALPSHLIPAELLNEFQIRANFADD